MSDLRELYQQVILEHSKSPRNFRKIDDADRVADGDNPLCGDQLTVYLSLDDDVIRDVSFEGSGCAISKASASLMTGSVKGKTTAEVEELFKLYHGMLTAKGPAEPDALGKLTVLRGVREFPIRVKCATLAWHTLNAAIRGKDQTVTTE